MARAARLRLLLGVAVLAAHLAVIDWFGDALDYSLRLERMPEPMFTRLLRPAAAPPTPRVPPPAVQAARRREDAIATRVPQPATPDPPRTAASSAAPAASAPEQPPVAAEPPSVAPAAAATEQPLAAAETPSVTAAPANPPASAAPPSNAGAVDPPTAAVPDTWPADTRLTYRVTGHLRGPVQGDARVQWQRQGTDYQARFAIDLGLLWSTVSTSQGTVTPQGLVPRAYEEERRGKRRGVRFGELAVALENDRTEPRPPGVQDAASQFVELAHRFATGRETLAVGKSAQVWLARPSSLNLWTYDVVGEEILQTPRLGPVVAFHLKPRPGTNPRGNLTPEMWFAPSMQYLPVRIRLSDGEGNHIDLMVDRIEQK